MRVLFFSSLAGWSPTAEAAPAQDSEFGLCRYRAVLFSAQTPSGDVAAIGKLLQEEYGFTVEIHPDATKAEIGSVLRDLGVGAERMRDCESLILYFAGRGSYDSGFQEGHWIPADATPDQAGWVSIADIQSSLQAIAARHTLVVADACFSGPKRDVRDVSRYVLAPGACNEWVRDAYPMPDVLALAARRLAMSDPKQRAPVDPPSNPSTGQLWTSAMEVTLRFVGSPSASGLDGDDLWVMESEVTQGLWTEVMGSNPSNFARCGTACPVEQVSWMDAVSFANALSNAEGLQAAYTIQGETVTWDRSANGYRLLTEAEWEFAARGGQRFLYAGSNEASSVGWVGENAVGMTHRACMKERNGYGLCDMTGNVGEWVYDGPASSSLRVYRGGSMRSEPQQAHVASRGLHAHRDFDLGFRLSRPAP